MSPSDTSPAKASAAPSVPSAPSSPPSAAGNGSGRLTLVEAAAAGMNDIAQLTGKQPEGVTGVEPTSDGWIISVDVIEDQHVPSTSDLLATYEAELGADGTLLAYKRINRYVRGRGSGGRIRG